jgi:gluconate kinase
MYPLPTATLSLLCNPGMYRRLERIRDAAFSLQHKSELGYVACSALKRKYRDAIRDGNSNQVLFVHLEVS